MKWPRVTTSVAKAAHAKDSNYNKRDYNEEQHGNLAEPLHEYKATCTLRRFLA
jgi:hypothetical protein